MVNDQFAQLIARHLAGESSEEEKKELEILLKQDPAAHYFYELFSGYWVNTPKKELNQLQEEIHFQQIIAIAEKEKDDQINRNKKTRYNPLSPIAVESTNGNGQISDNPHPSTKIAAFKQLLAAAIIVGVILSAYFIFFQRKAPSIATIPVSKNEMSETTKKGTRSVMRLPDGTKVWLNSDSKLDYNDFNPKNRQVTLSGEAYFDVTKDASHPFVVHTSDIDIRVLGTAFNVKSYPKESFIETTLIRGLVEVRNKKQPSEVFTLHPHQKLVFHKEDNQQGNTSAAQKSVAKKPVLIPLSAKRPDSALVETSWIYNKLIFEGEQFKEVALKMERWYNVRIIFRNDRVENLPIRYHIEDETIEQALKAIQVLKDFNFQIKGNEVEIY